MKHHEAMVETILEKIRSARNFDFRNYKRATLARRIERRMSDRGSKTHEDYIALLDREPHEFDALISSLLIKITAFFRDPEIWEELSKKLIPEMLARKRANEEVRIWCAGCSTGEEAFSIAILLCEALGPAVANYDIKIFGTDIDEAAIATARRGIYRDDQVENVPKPLLQRWFNRVPEGWAVKQEIRRIVVFGLNNLVSDAPISRLDLLICRNVFIYLDSALQKRVLARFRYALSTGGVLVLGRAELIPFAGKLFQQLDLGMRMYRRDGRRDAPDAQERGTQIIDLEGGRVVAAARDETLTTSTFHREILDAIGMPVVGTTREGAVTLWSNAAARLWGRTELDVLGKKLSTLALPGLGGNGLIEKTALVRDGKRDREVIDTGSMPQGTYAVEVRPLRDSAREVMGLVYIAHDVGALRQLEGETRRLTDELQGSTQKLQGSIEELRASNEELETTNEELQSANEELQTTNEELQSTNEELETTNEELQSANAELDATNRELAHRTEEAHVLSLYQRTLIRSLSAAIVVVDPGGKITAWNLAAERLLGLPEVEAVGQTLWTLRTLAITRQVMQRIRRSLGEGRAHREETVTYELPTGANGFATVAALPLLDGDRNLGAVILFEDVTRSTNLIKENQRLKDLAKASSRSAGRQASSSDGKAKRSDD